MTTAQGNGGRSSGRWTMLAVGAVGGAVLGRLGPVLLANVAGLIRGSGGRDPFSGLIREHRELLSLLTKMEETPQDSPLKRMGLFLKFKRTIAKHALAEEDIVYPCLKNDADRAQAIEKLYQEHAEMKVLLFELERAMKDDAKWVARVQDLRNEIEPHARQEEEIEFPKLRALMNGKRSAELGRKIDQEESLIV
jgi:iron-sulfur cluster repair protein YtfE (RIC family)